jgi:sec-independent protein translocase protein TatC
MTDKAQPAMPMLDHVIELRRRLLLTIGFFFLATAGFYFIAPHIYAFLVKPLADILGSQHRRMIYTGLGEAFVTYLKLACFAGGFITFPFAAMQLWRFVAPGLYKHEKGALLPFLALTPVLFTVGAAFAYYLVIPVAWRFFIGFETAPGVIGLPIEFEARVGEYLGFVMGIIFAFGICFLMPLVLILLGRVGVLSAEGLAAKRRYVIVVIFVIAAVLTPPDILSQFMLAVPMMVLFEISILCIRFYRRPKAELPLG